MSAYSSAVLADFPYVYYPDASAAPWEDAIGALDIAITGATPDVAGPLTVGDTRAFSFDGVDDSGSVALDLSDTSVVTIEFWLWWDTFTSDDDLAFEFDAAGDNGIQINPNSSAAASFGVFAWTGGSLNGVKFTRPSEDAWHHYAFVLDLTQPQAGEIVCYVDAAAVSTTPQAGSSDLTGPFRNATGYLMSRTGTSLFGAGDMAHFAVYKAPLTAERVAVHFNASGVTEQTAIWPFNRQGPF